MNGAARTGSLLLALAACGIVDVPTQTASIRVIRSPAPSDTILGFFGDSLIL